MTMSHEKILSAAQAKHRTGDLSAAAALYQQIISQNKQHPEALHMLGVIAQQKGNPTLALSLIEATLALAPMTALAWNNRALVLKTLGRIDDALQSSQYALTLDPNLAEAWELTGVIHLAQSNVSQALHDLQKATKLQPNNLSILSNLATALLQAGAVESALRTTHLLKSNTDAPHGASYSATIGNVLKAAGLPSKALPYYRRAIATHPDIKALHVNEATALLQMGNWAQAWPIWETRQATAVPLPHVPEWRGEKIDHLLLYEDQGMGDAINMLRYIPLLAGRVNRITLLTVSPLQRLLSANLIRVFVTTEAPQSADAQLRLMSLPALFSTLPTTIPAQPVLKTDLAIQARWHKKLAAMTKPRIGIIWSGNPSNRKDHVRSVPFETIRPFLETFAAHLVSLQRDASQEATAAIERMGLFNTAPELSDFNDTAALMAELDLIISVDTAGAHLAGALGKPVWLLNYFDPDFRWLLGRADTPWYPTMRQYRQTAPHDWAAVIQAITSDCKKFCAGDQNVLTPPAWHGSPLQEDPHAIKPDGLD